MTVQKRSTEKDQNASRLSLRLVEVLYDVKKISQESKDCINKSKHTMEEWIKSNIQQTKMLSL